MRHTHNIDGFPISCDDEHCQISSMLGQNISLSSCKQKIDWLEEVNGELLKALEAIRARIDGVFDHPSLANFGPLGHIKNDIRIIAEQAITKAEGRE